jgi:hypothetical protein
MGEFLTRDDALEHTKGFIGLIVEQDLADRKWDVVFSEAKLNKDVEQFLHRKEKAFRESLRKEIEEEVRSEYAGKFNLNKEYLNREIRKVTERYENRIHRLEKELRRVGKEEQELRRKCAKLDPPKPVDEPRHRVKVDFDDPADGNDWRDRAKSRM